MHLRKLLISFLTVLLLLLAFAGVASMQDDPTSNPLTGKIVALDAGHGGDDLGAQYPANAGSEGLLFEKDLNLHVVYQLRDRLEADGAQVVLTRVCDETNTSRRERVKIAQQKCEALGHACDALVSVHHNGSTDPNYDGLMVIYSSKKQQDWPLAQALHDNLWDALAESNPAGFQDLGYDTGGYGMTVYGDTVSALTEGYFITSDSEAAFFLDQGTLVTTTLTCDDLNTVQVPTDDVRIPAEVDGLYNGIVAYFAATSDGGDGGGDDGGDTCPPGKQKQGKC